MRGINSCLTTVLLLSFASWPKMRCWCPGGVETRAQISCPPRQPVVMPEHRELKRELSPSLAFLLTLILRLSHEDARESFSRCGALLAPALTPHIAG